MDSFVKRLVTVLTALFLLIYVGFQAYQIMNTTIEVETVGSYKVYDTVDVEGITIRNETVITQKVNGYTFYTTEDGGRVAKDGAIAHIFPSESDARMQQLLDQLDREIADLKSIHDQGTSNRANLSSINKQLNETWLSLIPGVPGILLYPASGAASPAPFPAEQAADHHRQGGGIRRPAGGAESGTGGSGRILRQVHLSNPFPGGGIFCQPGRRL